MHLRAQVDGPTAVGGDLPLDGRFAARALWSESTTVNAYAIKDMVVVVIRLKQLTPFERAMVDGGEPERVLALRAEFARVMAGRYTHAVEQVTGRTVVALLSQAHVDPDIIVEAFFLNRRFGSKVTEDLAEVIDLPEAADARHGGRGGGLTQVRWPNAVGREPTETKRRRVCSERKRTPPATLADCCPLLQCRVRPRVALVTAAVCYRPSRSSRRVLV